MLKADHTKVKQLLRRLNETNGVKQREHLCGEIEREIKMHSQIEEEIFYPAFKAATRRSEEEHLFYEATEEHHVVDMVLPALTAANPKSHEFEAKAKVLMDLIEHHIKEEEREMFTAAREALDEEQLRELGDMMTARKEALLQMWEHPLLRSVKKLQGVAQKLMPTKVKNVKAAAIATAMENRR
jgi:hemerythrin-like domain-containing protein